MNRAGAGERSVGVGILRFAVEGHRRVRYGPMRRFVDDHTLHLEGGARRRNVGADERSGEPQMQAKPFHWRAFVALTDGISGSPSRRPRIRGVTSSTIRKRGSASND